MASQTFATFAVTNLTGEKNMLPRKLHTYGAAFVFGCAVIAIVYHLIAWIVG